MMDVWNEFAVDSIHVSLTTQQRMLILKDIRDEVYIPIWVGTFEVDTIVIGLQEIEVSRPQTADLLKEAISHLNGKVQKVEIHKIQDETFYANIVIESAERTLRLDARPSDAIALAVRCRVPIFVSDAVTAAAAIRPEGDFRDSAAYRRAVRGTRFEDEGAPIEPADMAGLGVFDDFLKTLSGTETVEISDSEIEAALKSREDEAGDSGESPEDPEKDASDENPDVSL